MAHSVRLVSALLISTLAACGGKSFDAEPSPTGGGNAQGGNGQGGAAGASRGGTTSKAGAATGGSGQGGSAGTECADFEDATRSNVQVAIINKTSAAIYLGQDMVTCGVSPLFRVGDSSGAELSPPSSCSGSCQQVMDAGLIGCPAICAFPSTVALQAGETLYTNWGGLYQVERQLPKQCVPQDYGAATCQQTKGVRPGAFSFSAVAGRSIDCSATTGAACNACTPTPDGAGGCRTQGALIAGQMLSAVTNVQLDARYGIYGNPAPAPAPLPLPNPGGDGSGVSALLTVELVFTE